MKAAEILMQQGQIVDIFYENWHFSSIFAISISFSAKW